MDTEKFVEIGKENWIEDPVKTLREMCYMLHLHGGQSAVFEMMAALQWEEWSYYESCGDETPHIEGKECLVCGGS